jgi:hypothetical protein
MLNNRSFHQKFGWKAEKFFEDPKVIALCNAIEANDLYQMERLIAEGADVNATGKGNMTPLMWAFPDEMFERFNLLLELGADPNIKITDNLGVQSGFMKGDSVTTMSAKTRFANYFEAVMKHGGDPNMRNGFNQPVLHSIIEAPIKDCKSRCALALKQGADIEGRWAGGTPVITAVICGKFDIAIFLLEQGADSKAYHDDELLRVIHLVLRKEKDLGRLPPEYLISFERLTEWLRSDGEDLDAAREDLKRWATFSKLPSQFARQWKQEVEARKARER